ncbi:MAG: hypothetical protein H0X38_05500 [Planctomycetes bacterium]|nr:hypothetical protein [Planctomycetota bacterium]
MPGTYSMILRACPDASREAVTVLLGRAFSLKEATCASITTSTPIVLLTDLSRDEAAALSLALVPLESRGAVVEFTTIEVAELPKIDWPRRPLVFKRELADHVADCQIWLPCTTGGKPHRLVDLLAARIAGAGSRPGTTSLRGAAQEFRGTTLPEITPFSNHAVAMTPTAQAVAADQRADGGDPVARLNELFPDDDGGGFMPNNDDITNILDRLLPDDDTAKPSAPRTTPTTAVQPGSDRIPHGGVPAGFSVFLAKIADENRRIKAVPILAELTKFTTEEADALSKKPIIPVLKGVTKEEAESAKARFAKIGILARVKAPEG